MGQVHLILGGARSGKSRYAETLATATDLPVSYIATAQVFDDEFAARIAHHKAARPKHWQTIESAFNLAATLQAEAHENRCIIVDCLTLWLAQCICPNCAPANQPNNRHSGDTQASAQLWTQEYSAFIEVLPRLAGEIILVSNEVGMGIVPLGAINRQFQDAQGRLNQAVANIAQQVRFIAAGLPITLKG